MFVRELTADVQSLKGVGPATARLLQRLKIDTVHDLLLHLPREYQDRRHIEPLSSMVAGGRTNAVVRVVAQEDVRGRGRRTLKVYVEDESDRVALLCFGRDYLRRVLLPGKQFYLSGTFTRRYGEMQSTNFEVEAFGETPDSFRKILPLYPLTEGLTQNVLRKSMASALQTADGRMSDELPLWVHRKHGFPSKGLAVRRVHFPQTMEEARVSRDLLAYEELFYYQLLLGRKHDKRRLDVRRRPRIDFALRDAVLERLPFRLTDDQTRSLAEIEGDLFSEYPMARLLQGDVGCGKTLIALLSAVSVVESGGQVVFLAPTELLARQHAANASRVLAPTGVRCALLTASIGDPERKDLLAAIAAGEIDLVIGTHALFSAEVAYSRLGYVIVDEQHRFGVLQRAAMVEKGRNPDLLLMTATPIPRTLALTAFGDLDDSVIRSMPQGRAPIITHLAVEGREKKVYERVCREIDNGGQAYFVYPMIEDSDSAGAKNAESMYRALAREHFADRRVAVIHSRVPEDRQRAVMEAFIAGEIDILVATTVVEVGVDVPNATCMVVEHADRFGLSALHQLRGRVGRGPKQSYAFLIYSRSVTDDGVRRLKVMMETNDGFRIAEEDMAIRGPGELLGVRQAGSLGLKVANLSTDTKLLLAARSDARDLLRADPGLLDVDNAPVREVLSRVPPFTDEGLDAG